MWWTRVSEGPESSHSGLPKQVEDAPMHSSKKRDTNVGWRPRTDGEWRGRRGGGEQTTSRDTAKERTPAEGGPNNLTLARSRQVLVSW